MDESLGTGIADVMEFFRGFVVSCNYFNRNFGTGIADYIMANLIGGTIAPGGKTRLLIFESALNSFFTRIYSDVKRAYYKIDSDERVLRYTLFLSKKIGGKIREIEMDGESAGTLKLLQAFPAFFECARGKTVFFDELDSGIHDILMKNLISELKETFKGQFVATTHNTSLLEVLDPKGVFVIQVDSRGEKRILPISRIERTQRNHNNRNRYLNGVFSAIPVMGELDFKDIVERAEEELEEMG
jgi:hypothetical protein